MSGEAMAYVRAQVIKPVGLKYYMERIAARIDNDTGVATAAKQEYLADELSVNINTVRKLQAKALEMGYLVLNQDQVEGSKGRFTKNRYEIPGFVEWMAEGRESARAKFEGAIKPVTTRRDAVAEKPQPPVGITDRNHTEGLRTVTTRRDAPIGRSKEEVKEERKMRSEDRDFRQTGLSLVGGVDPKTAEPVRKDGKRYSSDFVDRFWSKYPRKEGKANAAKLWANMNAEDQDAAVAALPAYCNLKHVKEGLAKTGDKYLVERVYDDYAIDPAAERDDQIKRLALDLVSGNRDQLDRASKWWSRVADVPRDLLRAATAFAANEFGLQPAPAVAWGAA